MKVFRRFNSPSSRPPCALTIGNFDGVHRGHQVLLQQLVQGARLRNLSSCLLTFEPHPREFFSPKDAPPRIQNLRDKLVALNQLGLDAIVIEEFNQAFAQLSPEEFVAQILVKQLNAKWIFVGDDFCYGAKRTGNFASLKAAGQEYGFEVTSISTVLENTERISSSLVRRALELGNMNLASSLLGRPYSIAGHVLLETHVFDFNESVYGKLVCVELLERLHEERKYPDLKTLQAAIQHDAQMARDYFHKKNMYV